MMHNKRYSKTAHNGVRTLCLVLAMSTVALTTLPLSESMMINPATTSKSTTRSTHRPWLPSQSVKTHACASSTPSEDTPAAEDEKKTEGTSLPLVPSRRSVLQSGALASTAILAPLCLGPSPSRASPPTPATASLSTTTLPPITHEISLSVRISRSDGTFYIRDDPPGTIPTPENTVFYGILRLGLFGTVAPIHVQRFLQYAVAAGYSPTDDTTPEPSYSRSLFQAIDPDNGLLLGGVIPGLTLTTVVGSPALEYRGRILPAPLWIEVGSSGSDGGGGEGGGGLTRGPVSHDAFPGGGLLTHRNLDASPAFGITTRGGSGYKNLDRTHTVFGRVLFESNNDRSSSSGEEEIGDSRAFLDRVEALPTYLGDRIPQDQDSSSSVVEGAAETVFSIQKNFFRNAAKSLGDTRLDNVYEGKILRRVEVTDVKVKTLSSIQ